MNGVHFQGVWIMQEIILSREDLREQGITSDANHLPSFYRSPLANLPGVA
jgi:hypothetical protein